MPRKSSPPDDWEHRSRRFRAIAGRANSRARANPQDEPDLVLHGGVVRTMAPGTPLAEGLAVRDGRVVAVGTSEEVTAMAGPRTRKIDLAGRVAVPGLNDSHLHQLRAAADVPKVPLDSARNVAEVVALVGERVATTPAGEWVECRTLWHESLLTEGRLPTRHDLDSVSPEHPVYLPRGGHVATVNSMALRRAGIGPDTPDPEGGTIVRDVSGAPTGVLLERARDLLSAVLPPEGCASERADLLARQMAALNQMGVTSVTDPGLLPDELDVYLTLRESNRMTVRSRLLLRVHDAPGVESALGAMRPCLGDDLLTFGGFKYSIDGGVEGAALQQPYQLVEGEQTDQDYRGELILPPAGHPELHQMYMLAARVGFQFQTHAVGDAAAEALIDHYEQVNASVPLRDLRWVVVHLSMPTARVLMAMRQMGLLSTMQDNAVQLGRNQLRWWGEERARAANPLRSVMDAGITVGGGTDGPVVPTSPFLSMWWMTTRGMVQGGVLGPEHAISGEEALRLYTRDSAVTQFVDSELGMLAEGMVADVAVLDADPATIAPDRIRDLECSLTLLGGVPVYER